MTYGTQPEIDDRPGTRADSSRLAIDHEALLDHHVEELLGAFSDLAVVTLESDE